MNSYATVVSWILHISQGCYRASGKPHCRHPVLQTSENKIFSLWFMHDPAGMGITTFELGKLTL